MPELSQIRQIAQNMGLQIEDLYGYPPSFESYLIQMRIRAHLTRLRKELNDLEAVPSLLEQAA